jgi:hypothetical protein
MFLTNARARGKNAPDGYDLFPIHFSHITQNPLMVQNDPY